MSKNLIGVGVSGVLVGASVMYFIFQSTPNQKPIIPTPSPQIMVHDMNAMGMAKEMTMTSMVDSLRGKTGDDFDKLFISEMIEHHQGAVDMALLATQSAHHSEIRTMAEDIISAQTKEIGQMRSWQQEWKY